MTCHVSISFDNDWNSNKPKVSVIKENNFDHGFPSPKYHGESLPYMNKFYNFGFECFLNSKKEAIIVVIGGTSRKFDGSYYSRVETDCNDWQRQVIMYNCVTRQLVRKAKVEFYIHLYLFPSTDDPVYVFLILCCLICHGMCTINMR